jgi:hypothetical protein
MHVALRLYGISLRSVACGGALMIANWMLQAVDMGAGDDIKEEEEVDQEGHLHCPQERMMEEEATIAGEVDGCESKAQATEEDTIASGHQDQHQHAPQPRLRKLEPRPSKVRMRREREAGKRSQVEFERLRAEMRALRVKMREELHRKASKRKPPPPR